MPKDFIRIAETDAVVIRAILSDTSRILRSATGAFHREGDSTTADRAEKAANNIRNIRKYFRNIDNHR